MPAREREESNDGLLNGDHVSSWERRTCFAAEFGVAYARAFARFITDHPWKKRC